MPENQRRAILLREWQGLTYREISTELGLTQAAVETLIFRARRALAQGLEQDADTWKKRLRRGADVGGAIAFVKALLGGGGAAAVKVAATAIAVAATAVTAATEMPRHAAPRVGRQAGSCCDSARHASERADDRFELRRPVHSRTGRSTQPGHPQLQRAQPPEAGRSPGIASRRDDERTGSRPADVRAGKHPYPHSRRVSPSPRSRPLASAAPPRRPPPTTARATASLTRKTARRRRRTSRPRRRPLRSQIRPRRSPIRVTATTRTSPTSRSTTRAAATATATTRPSMPAQPTQTRAAASRTSPATARSTARTSSRQRSHSRPRSGG